jgi:tRNA A-37 threonylcarbamoyl transferase component Bud32
MNELTTAVETSVASMMSLKNRIHREKVIRSGTRLSQEAVDFCTKMIYEFVETAYMRYFLADIRTTFKNETDVIPSCIKGKSISNMTPIGEGADGAVFQLSDGSVVKIGDVLTHKEHPLPDVYHEMAHREIEIAKVAGKAGIAPKVLDAYYCCSSDACKYVIHMSKVEGTTLHTWNKSASDKEKSNMSKKIMTQLKKMHKLGISHSDLHARNIMVDGNKPVIIDFSRSVWMNEKQGKYDVMQIQGIFEKIPTRLDSLVTLVVYDLLAKKLISVK